MFLGCRYTVTGIHADWIVDSAAYSIVVADPKSLYQLQMKHHELRSISRMCAGVADRVTASD